ncbi:hypothetical protein HZA97_08050 [Candidatus Woesearchaeota archaeon]|nr:hypothetical protein [Candidatus Woesearchaeota archaeon]
MLLQQTLEQLSEEGRKKFLEQLLKKAKDLKPEPFDIAYQASLKFSVELGAKYLLAKNQNETAVLLLENYQKYTEAARLCKTLGIKDRAVENFERAKEIKDAVEVYLGVSNYKIETTEVVIGQGHRDYIDELEKTEKENNHAKAADQALALGMIKRAAKNLKLAGREQEAEELLKNSNPIKAAQVWERNRKTNNAISLLFRNDLNEEVASTYERAGDFFSAGMSYHYQQNNLEKALECYKKAGYNEGISRVLSQMNKPEELVKHWEETNNSLAIAEYYQDKDPQKAAKFYEEIKSHKKAAECLIKTGKASEGLQLLIEHCLFEDAVELGEKVSNAEEDVKKLVKYCYKEVAAKNEKIQPTKSLEYYEKAGDQEKAKELAAKLMKEQAGLGNFNKALEYAIKAEDKTAEELYKSITGILK